MAVLLCLAGCCSTGLAGQEWRCAVVVKGAPAVLPVEVAVGRHKRTLTNDFPEATIELPPGDHVLIARRGKLVFDCESGSWTGPTHSHFTSVLLDALAGKGSNGKEGLVELVDVVRWIGLKLPARSRGEQMAVLDFAQVTGRYCPAKSWWSAAR
jgi:hypothetical protein